MSGKLIVVEGLEGSGKSTAIDTLVKQLQRAGLPVHTVREPGGTAIGETLRTLLKNVDYKSIMDARTELLLLYAARIQLLEEVIKPELQQGTWVIADRFELSSFAYQGGGRGLDLSFIKALSNFCLGNFAPDLTLFLDIDPLKGMERARKRGQFDRIEQESIDFFHRINETYQRLIKQRSDVIRIDAAAELARVQEDIEGHMASYIQRHTRQA